MIRRPPRSTLSSSSAASDVYKRQPRRSAPHRAASIPPPPGRRRGRSRPTTGYGDGNQWWAWIDLDDALAAVEWMLHDEELSGVVNVTAPEPVTNLEFTKTLGHVLHRPAALAAPRFAVAKGLGGMGEEMFLASQRAVPARLRGKDFRFTFPELEPALRYELGR